MAINVEEFTDALHNDEVGESEDQANADALHNDEHLSVPDMFNDSSVDQFKLMLDLRVNKHGIIGLKKLIDRCRNNVELFQRQFDIIKTTVARLNGDRTPLQAVGDKSRSLRNTAKRFYESLSTPGLRAQCTLFDVDYDSYESMEDVIAALVEKHLEMNM